MIYSNRIHTYLQRSNTTFSSQSFRVVSCPIMAVYLPFISSIRVYLKKMFSINLPLKDFISKWQTKYDELWNPHNVCQKVLELHANQDRSIWYYSADFHVFVLRWINCGILVRKKSQTSTVMFPLFCVPDRISVRMCALGDRNPARVRPLCGDALNKQDWFMNKIYIHADGSAWKSANIFFRNKILLRETGNSKGL